MAITKKSISQSAKKKSYTAASIVAMVDKKRNSQAFRDLFDQIDTDFDLFALKPYQGDSGHQAYTSPAARNDFLKVYHGVNKASLTWQIVVPEDAPKEERDKASKGEALLSGILNDVDRQHRKVGEPPLREGVGWIGCGRGVAALKCLIYTDLNGEQTVDVKEWDPLHMAWEKGADGLAWASYEYTVSKEEAEERWGVKLSADECRVIDFFDRKTNAVVLAEGTGQGEGDSQFVKKPTDHGLGHVPVFLGFVGGMPTIYTKNKDATLKYRANSVWASSRNVYPTQNKQISFIMDTAEKSVAGTLVHRKRGGGPLPAGIHDPYSAWSVINMDSAMEETLEPLKPPEVPKESAVILGLLDRDKQESTVPYPIGYGLDPQAHSGAALAMMNDNTRSVYGPFTSLMEEAWTWLCEEILGQFKAKGQTMKLKGFDQQGKFFVMDASPDDVEPDWYIVVRCEPKLPRDEQGEMQMALAATSPRGPTGRPLLSDLSTYEKLLKLQNPDGEIARIDDQQVRAMINAQPAIAIRKTAMALLDKGDRESALELLNSIPAPGGPGGSAPGATPGQPPAVPQQQIPPEAQQMIMEVSQKLGIPPEQVLQMTPEQVAAAMQTGGMP